MEQKQVGEEGFGHVVMRNKQSRQRYSQWKAQHVSGRSEEEPEASEAGARRSGHTGKGRSDHRRLAGLVKDTGFTLSDVGNGKAFGSVRAEEFLCLSTHQMFGNYFLLISFISFLEPHTSLFIFSC